MGKKVAARTLDFSNVKDASGINPKHVEDGEYLAKCIEVRDDPAKDGEAMWLFIFKLADNATATYPYYCKLVDSQLWKLRNLFLAAGQALPKRAVKIDPNKVLGKEVGLILETEEYEGKEKSVIAGIIPKDELTDYAPTESDDDDDEDDEEEEVPVKKSRRKAAPVEDDDEDDEEEDDEPEEKPVSKRTAARRAKAKAAAAEEEEDDDDEEEEEPAPRKRKKPAAKAAPSKKKRRKSDDDDDDLDLDL